MIELPEGFDPAKWAACPKCNGAKREPAPPRAREWRLAGYDPATDTMPCDNCGGQTMMMSPRGYTRVDPSTGLGCLHDYVGRKAGNCYHIYTCKKCGDTYDIDSGD